MNEKLNVTIALNDTITIQGNSIILDPYSTTTGRKFKVENLQCNEGLDISYRDTLSITISYLKHNNEVVFLSEFKIVLLDFGELNSVDWWFYGLVESSEEYKQGITNIFNLWQKKEVFDWFSLSYNAPQKEEYLHACRIYTSLSKTIKGKKYLKINVSKAREYRDLLYLMSITFGEDRSYFGYNFYTFCDCLLELYHNDNEVFNDCIIEFIGIPEMNIMDDDSFFKDIINEFLKYNISIVYETP